MTYGGIDAMMTGHSSPADLAAMGLGASVYSSVFMGLMGVISALNPIVAHHYRHYSVLVEHSFGSKGTPSTVAG